MNIQQAPTTNRQPSTTFLVAKILNLVLENGIARATHQMRPHSVEVLHAPRIYLLQDPFFDPDHRMDELGYRTHPVKVSFVNIVVLLARLMRVLMQQEPLGEEHLTERITVRNECLDLPFFGRERVDLRQAFGEDDVEDEGCFV